MIAIEKYQNSSSPVLMRTRRPPHSLGASGKLRRRAIVEPDRPPDR